MLTFILLSPPYRNSISPATTSCGAGRGGAAFFSAATGVARGSFFSCDGMRNGKHFFQLGAPALFA